MTVIKTNKKTRDVAIPFEANRYGGYAGGAHVGEGDILLEGTDLMDALKFGFDQEVFSYNRSTSVIRLCTPDRGQLVSAVLDLEISVASSLTVKIGVGRFDEDGINPVYDYSQEEIDRVHELLTGSTAAISSQDGLLWINGLDIFPALPKKGTSQFNRDGFVLILQFNRVNDPDVFEPIRNFSVTGSALMGLFK